MRHPAEILFSSKHPLMAAFDVEFLGAVDHVLTVTVTAPDSYADDGGRQVHTGFLTLMLDTVMGSCAIGELKELQPIATIKLSCNHLRQPDVGELLTCKAKVVGQASSVSYVTGEILAGDSQELIAHGIGTFMIGTRAKPLEQR